MKPVDRVNRAGGLEWDDLRFVLAVAEGGNLAQAALRLKVSHTTVFRRVKELETRIGTRLFTRGKQGYTPTNAAATLIELAGKLELEINRVVMGIAGIDERPSGNVRVSTVELLLRYVLRGVLPRLRSELPLIQMELNTSNSILDLNKRETDICLRFGNSPPESLIGRQVCTMVSTIYAPRAWRHASMNNLREFPWVMPNDSLSQLTSSQWLVDQGLEEKVVFRSNSRECLADAAEGEIGLVILPCYVGDQIPALRRVCDPLPEFDSQLWILYHRELRNQSRISAVVERLHTILSEHRALFEGQQALMPE